MAGAELIRSLRSLPLEDALERVMTAAGCETGTVHRLSSDGALELEAHAGPVPPGLLAVIRSIPVGKGLAGLAAERGEPVRICNLQTDDSGAARPGARSTGMRGSICVPMTAAGRTVGVLGVASAREREFGEAEAAWLCEAAAALAAHW